MMDTQTPEQRAKEILSEHHTGRENAGDLKTVACQTFPDLYYTSAEREFRKVTLSLLESGVPVVVEDGQVFVARNSDEMAHYCAWLISHNNSLWRRIRAASKLSENFKTDAATEEMMGAAK